MKLEQFLLNPVLNVTVDIHSRAEVDVLEFLDIKTQIARILEFKNIKFNTQDIENHELNYSRVGHCLDRLAEYVAIYQEELTFPPDQKEKLVKSMLEVNQALVIFFSGLFMETPHTECNLKRGQLEVFYHQLIHHQKSLGIFPKEFLEIYNKGGNK